MILILPEDKKSKEFDDTKSCYSLSVNCLDVMCLECALHYTKNDIREVVRLHYDLDNPRD